MSKVTLKWTITKNNYIITKEKELVNATH